MIRQLMRRRMPPSSWSQRTTPPLEVSILAPRSLSAVVSIGAADAAGPTVGSSVPAARSSKAAPGTARGPSPSTCPTADAGPTAAAAYLNTLLTGLYVKIDDEIGGTRWMGRPPLLTDSELVCLAVAQALLRRCRSRCAARAARRRGHPGTCPRRTPRARRTARHRHGGHLFRGSARQAQG